MASPNVYQRPYTFIDFATLRNLRTNEPRLEYVGRGILGAVSGLGAGLMLQGAFASGPRSLPPMWTQVATVALIPGFVYISELASMGSA